MKQDNLNPYASPEASIHDDGKDYFVDPLARASITIKAFYAVIVIQILFIFVQLWRSTTFEEFLLTQSNYEMLEKGDEIEIALVGIQVIATIALIIFFLRWFHQCYKNLPALEVANLDHTPGWAVGWFFVPIANLVKPYSVAYEMWHSSEAKDGTGDQDASWVVICWWLFFLLAHFFDRYVLRKSQEAKSLEDYLELMPIDVASSVVSIIGAAFAINLVKRLTRRQQQRHESL